MDWIKGNEEKSLDLKNSIYVSMRALEDQAFDFLQLQKVHY